MTDYYTRGCVNTNLLEYDGCADEICWLIHMALAKDYVVMENVAACK